MAKKKNKKKQKFVSAKKQHKQAKAALKLLLQSQAALNKFKVILQMQNYSDKDVKRALKTLIKTYWEEHEIDPEDEEIMALLEQREYVEGKKRGDKMNYMNPSKKAMNKYIDDHYDFEEQARLQALRNEFGDLYDQDDLDVYADSEGGVVEDLRQYLYDPMADDDDDDWDPWENTGKKAAKRADKIKKKNAKALKALEENKKKDKKKKKAKKDDKLVSDYYLGGEPIRDIYKDSDDIPHDGLHTYVGYETYEDIKDRLAENELLAGAKMEVQPDGQIDVHFKPASTMQAREFAMFQMYRGVWSEDMAYDYIADAQIEFDGDDPYQTQFTPIIQTKPSKKNKNFKDGYVDPSQIKSEEDVIAYCEQQVNSGKWSNQEADEVLEAFRQQVQSKKEEPKKKGFMNYVDLNKPVRAADNIISGIARTLRGEKPKDVIKEQRKVDKSIKSRLANGGISMEFDPTALGGAEKPKKKKRKK